MHHVKNKKLQSFTSSKWRTNTLEKEHAQNQSQVTISLQQKKTEHPQTIRFLKKG